MTTILIAEDDTLLRNLYGKVLKNDGHTLLFAESVATTLELLKTYTPDVLLLDMKMTDGSSVPVLNHVKGNATFTHMRVIVVTGNRQFEQEATHLGADFFMSKPVSARHLSATVTRVLQ